MQRAVPKASFPLHKAASAGSLPFLPTHLALWHLPKVGGSLGFSWGDYAPTPARGQLAMSGDIFGCHDWGGV